LVNRLEKNLTGICRVFDSFQNQAHQTILIISNGYKFYKFAVTSGIIVALSIFQSVEYGSGIPDLKRKV